VTSLRDRAKAPYDNWRQGRRRQDDHGGGAALPSQERQQRPASRILKPIRPIRFQIALVRKAERKRWPGRNLDGREINQPRDSKSSRRLSGWTDDLFESLTAASRWEIQFDREAMRELVALARRIDEIAPQPRSAIF